MPSAKYYQQNPEYYKKLRTKHLNEQRSEYEPCKRCISA